MDEDLVLIITTGRRRVRVFRDKDKQGKVYLEILLGKEHLATLEMDKQEAQKLIKELMRALDII